MHFQVTKRLFVLNPLKGPTLDLYVKGKITHKMKCIKLLNELPDVTWVKRLYFCTSADRFQRTVGPVTPGDLFNNLMTSFCVLRCLLHKNLVRGL